MINGVQDITSLRYQWNIEEPSDVPSRAVSSSNMRIYLVVVSANVTT